MAEGRDPKGSHLIATIVYATVRGGGSELNPEKRIAGPAIRHRADVVREWQSQLTRSSPASSVAYDVAVFSFGQSTILVASKTSTLSLSTLPDISNNAGSCQELFLYFLFSLFFFRAHNSIHSEEWSYSFR